jgi:hypothetical protein
MRIEVLDQVELSVIQQTTVTPTYSDGLRHVHESSAYLLFCYKASRVGGPGARAGRAVSHEGGREDVALAVIPHLAAIPVERSRPTRGDIIPQDYV